MYVCMSVCLCIYVCMYVYVCMCMYVCMYVCLFVPSRYSSRSVNVFDRMLLKGMRVLGLKNEEVAGGWVKKRNEETSFIFIVRKVLHELSHQDRR